MVCKHLLMALCAVALSSLNPVNGKYRISWITNKELYSGTGHWVGFELFNADRTKTKTKWMWPNKKFETGHSGSEVFDEPSIGDIAKVNVHIQKFRGQVHRDDWNGYQVTVSDSVTKKVYEFFPGNVETGAYQKYNVQERQCRDRYPSENCGQSTLGNHCGDGPPKVSIFFYAKYKFLRCLKTCYYCYPPDSDEPEEEEAREDAKQTDDDSSAEHAKKSTSHKKKNKENNE